MSLDIEHRPTAVQPIEEGAMRKKAVIQTSARAEVSGKDKQVKLSSKEESEPPPEIDMRTIRGVPENDEFEVERDPRAEFLEHLR